MRKQLLQTINQGRLSKKDRATYFLEMENILYNMSGTDPHILKFAKDFLNSLQLSDAKDGDTVKVGPIDIRLLEYLIISIIVNYQDAMKNS